MVPPRCCSCTAGCLGCGSRPSAFYVYSPSPTTGEGPYLPDPPREIPPANRHEKRRRASLERKGHRG